MSPNCLSLALGLAGRVLGDQFGGAQNLLPFYLAGFLATFSKKVAEEKISWQQLPLLKEEEKILNKKDALKVRLL